MTTITLATTLLAQTRDTGPDFGKASPIGLLVVVLLLIAVFLLVRSMNKQLRKVPESFDSPEQPAVGTDTGTETGTETGPREADGPSGGPES
ncbi:Uncharacterised protein [Mycolicibacterium phlei]|jgi:hypothetical protein|uniref:Uncharacterized protein n=1 Tax=Mycolicibacterium phlei DSM 43239 = CCUG 21000 TaxID=1226750 RepID=A0A5N5V2D2_MYCPH|nr:hypothetical protein [Mycolicibacterium phlei]VEG11142.1 Uncharacterised protein [Mycobacteroides chelonae]AMO63044.1 hypothetical protein MPHLCCUG_04256 [Mycolicibacterium phlei]KAB7756053.1 hypothetical protein MPHL21000_12380 [Mycolicibacterium phlei DSM 43239 = CCUG 21000]KXW65717.1 hypothetical protein MPHL43239_09845 [Mycolicibacterium phlei DSM 43239 = CCUG 21000]KXW66145.1 hypothetical protein MPHL43070_21330 [Mycolicibacterium phlei DSM 43070]